MRILKKNFKVLFLVVFAAVASCSFTTKEFNDPDKDKVLLNLISYVIQKGHYDARAMDDSFSADVYENFLKGLDPLKRYFLASDIKEFSNIRPKLTIKLKTKILPSLMWFTSVSESGWMRLPNCILKFWISL